MRLFKTIACLTFILFLNMNVWGETELAPQGASSDHLSTPDPAKVRRNKNPKKQASETFKIKNQNNEPKPSSHIQQTYSLKKIGASSKHHQKVARILGYYEWFYMMKEYGFPKEFGRVKFA